MFCKIKFCRTGQRVLKGRTLLWCTPKLSVEHSLIVRCVDIEAEFGPNLASDGIAMLIANSEELSLPALLCTYS